MSNKEMRGNIGEKRGPLDFEKVGVIAPILDTDRISRGPKKVKK